MSHPTKKRPVNDRFSTSSSVAKVMSRDARFAPENTEMNFAYFHSMDIWQKTEVDLRHKLRKIKGQEELEKPLS